MLRDPALTEAVASQLGYSAVEAGTIIEHYLEREEAQDKAAAEKAVAEKRAAEEKAAADKKAAAEKAAEEKKAAANKDK